MIRLALIWVACRLLLAVRRLVLFLLKLSSRQSMLLIRCCDRFDRLFDRLLERGKEIMEQDERVV